MSTQITKNQQLADLHQYCTPWAAKTPPSDSSPEDLKWQSLQKMWKNLNKALEEHTQSGAPSSSVATREQLMTSFIRAEDPSLPLTSNHWFADDIGGRPSMEDEHLIAPREQEILLGVFDGHGGKGVATFAKKYTEEKFSTLLKENKGDIRLAFNTLFHEMHTELLSNPKARKMGSTVVISHIDTMTRVLTTATLGDSQTVVFRKIEGKLTAIPVSCVRDWSSSKDKLRFGAAWGDMGRVDALLKNNSNPKSLRYPFAGYGTNVARSLGDFDIAQGNMVDRGSKVEVVSHKPKITSMLLNANDLILCACDGLFDFVTLEEIITCLNALPKDADIAKALVQLALEKGKGADNVTVIALKLI